MKTYQIGTTHYAEVNGMTAVGNSKEDAVVRLTRVQNELTRRSLAYPLALAYAKQGKLQEAYKVIGGGE
jgi:hypothetical protein